MRFVRSEPFKRDYQRLSGAERERCRAALTALAQAYERAPAGERKPSPKGFAVTAIANVAGLYALRWNQADPEGWVTWEWGPDEAGDGTDPVIVLRRIGRSADSAG